MLASHSLAEQFLIAMPALQDSIFARTVSLICQHDDAHVSAEHEQFAMTHVDDSNQTEHHGQTQGDKREDKTCANSVESNREHLGHEGFALRGRFEHFAGLGVTDATLFTTSNMSSGLVQFGRTFTR